MSISDIEINNAASLNLSSVVSAEDLDEMVDNNLKLLNSIESRHVSSKDSCPSSKRYHSSLSIYINPRESLRSSDRIYYSNCNIFPMQHSQSRNNQNDSQMSNSNSVSEQLTKSSLYSSYETLYDKLRFNLKDEETKSLTDGYKKANNVNNYDWKNTIKTAKHNSSDSENTLKSSSSSGNVSSPVSSIESLNKIQDSSLNRPKKHLVPDKSGLKIIQYPKVRVSNKNNYYRPTSCYVDKTFGQYSYHLKNANPNVVTPTGGGLQNKYNFVISKPLMNYPGRLTDSFLSIPKEANHNNSSKYNDNNNNNHNHNHNKDDNKSCLSLKPPLNYTRDHFLNNNRTNILNHYFMQNESIKTSLVHNGPSSSPVSKQISVEQPTRKLNQNSNESSLKGQTQHCTKKDKKGKFLSNILVKSSRNSDQSFPTQTFNSTNIFRFPSPSIQKKNDISQFNRKMTDK